MTKGSTGVLTNLVGLLSSTKLSLDVVCPEIIVFAVVVEFESDSFSKLPPSSFS